MVWTSVRSAPGCELAMPACSWSPHGVGAGGMPVDYFN